MDVCVEPERIGDVHSSFFRVILLALQAGMALEII
uniref:Uncharacterized protein n=1 Tax=Anguilla anguilla TaxID=7936 RepID=A0A0E9TNM9_ANGAN